MTSPVVQLAGLYARDAFGFVLSLDLALPAGTVGALIGTPQDGTLALAQALAGSLSPLRGTVTVGGFAPFASPSTRAQIGALLDDPRLPDIGTVRELFALSRALRGERTDREPWFQELGVADLLATPVSQLDLPQARTVALGLALSVPAPLLLVLFEPLSYVVQAAAPMLRDLLKQRANEGACVLVLTASSADAVALAEDVATLQKGSIGRAIGAPDVDELAPGAALEVRVWTNKPREIAAALALDSSVQSVWLSTGQPGAPIILQTLQLDACAKAVTRVVCEQQAELLGLQAAPPGTTQMHEATYRLARSGGGS